VQVAEALAANKANMLLDKAQTKAIEALLNPDCAKIFLPSDRSTLTDPKTGNALNPIQVLQILVLSATGRGDAGYGNH
jgi:hypothetical protein